MADLTRVWYPDRAGEEEASREELPRPLEALHQGVGLVPDQWDHGAVGLTGKMDQENVHAHNGK